MTLARGSWIVALVALALAACAARNPEQESAGLVAITLQLTNNLNSSLDVRIEVDNGLLWRGSVGPGSVLNASPGNVPVNTPLTLRAINERGIVVSVREKVPARATALIWTIP